MDRPTDLYRNMARLELFHRDGKGDSPEADAVRDLMDKPWFGLDETGRAEIQQWSVALTWMIRADVERAARG